MQTQRNVAKCNAEEFGYFQQPHEALEIQSVSRQEGIKEQIKYVLE